MTKKERALLASIDAARRKTRKWAEKKVRTHVLGELLKFSKRFPKRTFRFVGLLKCVDVITGDQVLTVHYNTVEFSIWTKRRAPVTKVERVFQDLTRLMAVYSKIVKDTDAVIPNIWVKNGRLTKPLRKRK